MPQIAIKNDQGVTTAAEQVNETETVIAEEGQVIVHCFIKADAFIEKVRIWQSTFLIDNDSSHKSKLIFADNIKVYPDWTDVAFMQNIYFTLIFSPLPKNCSLFHLLEDIPENGGFKTSHIKRNKTDVYQVDLSD